MAINELKTIFDLNKTIVTFTYSKKDDIKK